MGTRQKSDDDQRQFWQMVLETYRTSGLSVRRFCRQEGLSEPSFYTRRKKLTKVNDLELVLHSGHILRINAGISRQRLTDVLTALCEAGLC